MSAVVTGMTTSVDGFVAGADDGPDHPLGEGAGVERLFRWYEDGDTPSAYYPWMKLSAASARFFDAFAARFGAVISGRRTYDLTHGWGGDGPLPGVPLFTLTHRPPDSVPRGSSRYAFVTDGIESAVRQAIETAGSKDVSLMGASVVQQALRAGLVDELIISQVPVVLGRGIRLLDNLEPGTVELELADVVDARGVTHLRYRVLHEGPTRPLPPH
jgi:dihydrofolate reductase